MKLKSNLKFNPAIRLISFCITFLLSLNASSQVTRIDYDEIKDSIIKKFNRNDFKGIYQLFDTSFSSNISEEQLVNFLKGNQNSGKIVKSSFKSKNKDNMSYLIELELRDMIMNLQITPDKKISSFGLMNFPPVILSENPVVNSNNLKKSALDIAVDSVALEYFRYSKANSLAIGLIKNGKKYFYYYGETNRGNGKLPTSQTLYEIGSITKTFTATILAQAVLDGKVLLTDDIRKYIGEDFSNLSYNGIPITLQDLANHTSGLPSLPQDIGDYPDYNPTSPESHYDSTMFYRALQKVSIDTVPGCKFLYSNWGISLLGHILEKVYRQKHDYLVKRYVTEPLRMSHTIYITNENGHEVAMPHSENDKRIALTNQGYFSPAGGLCSTIEDMLLYLNAQLQEKKASIRLTHVPTANNIGLGWGVRKIDSTRELQHNGSEQGSTANISAFPEINSGCVIFVNNKVNLGKVIISIHKILKSSFYM